MANRCSSCSAGVRVSGWGGRRERGKKRRRKTGRPAAYLVKLGLGRDPQLRVYGALQRLDDPVEVHVPGRGLRPQGQQAGLQPGCLLAPLGPVRRREPPPHPQPLPPTPPPAATCCATLTPRPLSSLLPPHSFLSIHPLRQPVGGGRRGSGDCFTTASSPGANSSRGERHDAVRKKLQACSRPCNTMLLQEVVMVWWERSSDVIHPLTAALLLYGNPSPVHPPVEAN